MKKLLLIALTAVLFAVTGQAQDRKLSYIPTIGYQASTPMDQVGDIGYYSRLDGFRAGLDIDYKLVDKVSMDLSLRPGLYYSRKGHKIKDILPVGGPGDSFDVSVALDYIELPIQVVLALNWSPTFSAFINAGPYFGYGVAGQFKGDSSFGSPYDNGYKRFDAGFQGGFGIEYLRFILGFGVQVGLTNLGMDAAFLLTDKTTSQTLFVSLGYRF